MGASLTLIYGIIRLDPILMLGQSVSILIFARNLYIGLRYTRHNSPARGDRE